MKLSFDYKGIKVTYYLTYKKAKAISIKVTDDGQVNVIAPLGTSVYSVMDKVKGNAPWIISEVYRRQNPGVDPNTRAEREIKLLDQYMYSGKNYKLEIINNAEADAIKVKMVRGKFVVETATDSVEAIRGAIVEWYKQKVKAKMKERFKEYGDAFEVIPTEIEFTDEMNFLFKANKTQIVADAKLGVVPGDVMDYVLVSGLCRINTQDDASESEKMKEVLPNYEKSKAWLEENKSLIIL